MITKNPLLTLWYTGCFLLTAGSLLSCIQMKSISRGSFNNQLEYNYSYFVYSKVFSGSDHQNTKSQKNSCRVYLADIRKDKNHILEKMVYYSCSDHSPFKIILDYDAAGKMTGTHYFPSVTDSSYILPLSFDERWVFLEMAKHHMPGDYADYPMITGFRPATTEDSIEALPFLKDVAKSKLM